MISTSCQSSSEISSTSLRISESEWSRWSGSEQFRLVVDRLEQKRHRPVQGIALGQQQQPVEFLFLRAVELEFDHLLLVQAGQIDVLGMFDDLGRAVVACPLPEGAEDRTR